MFEVIRTNSFFLRKNLERTKTQIKPKPTNKTKTSEQKTIKATIFRAEKLLRGGKMFILSFLKNRIVLITSFIIPLTCIPISSPIENLFAIYLFGPCDLQFKLVIIIQQTSNNKVFFVVAQVWPCHIQIVDYLI